MNEIPDYYIPPEESQLAESIANMPYHKAIKYLWSVLKRNPNKKPTLLWFIILFVPFTIGWIMANIGKKSAR